MMKLALFDFCETLVNFQTADVFVDYTLRMYGRYKKYYILANKSIFVNFLNRYWKLKKKIHLFFLRGLTEEELVHAAKGFYLEYIEPNTFNCMKKIILDYKNNGYKTYIISGGYTIYIDLYAKNNGIDGIIANEFMYKISKGRKVFTGFICEKDCMGNEKIKRLERVFKNINIDESISFSDSPTDKPVLDWADKGVLVSKYKEREFAVENSYDQIVLSKLGDNKLELEESLRFN